MRTAQSVRNWLSEDGQEAKLCKTYGDKGHLLVSSQSSQLIVYVNNRCLDLSCKLRPFFGIDNLLIVTADGDVYVVRINIPLMVMFML